MDGSTECNGLDRIYRERKMWKDCWFVSCNKVLLSSIVFRAGLERKYIAAAALGGGGGGGKRVWLLLLLWGKRGWLLLLLLCGKHVRQLLLKCRLLLTVFAF
jgi:hypothetical protein